MSNKQRYDDISDDEIRIIGDSKEPRNIKRLVILALVVVAVVAGVVALVVARPNTALTENNETEEQIPIYGEESEPVVEDVVDTEHFSRIKVAEGERAFTELRDTTINDVPLRLYIPHNAELSLHVGKMDREDEDVVYTAEAAFIRADNHAILGAFVLKGEPLAWGLSMRGYCASIDGEVTVGVADNSPLFEEAINSGGYFFRQYPLVDNGVFVANEPKNKSVRRAICERRGEIFMIESLTKESFHDFTQALVDLGVDNAVNLAGSEAYGWAIDRDGVKHEFGTPNFYTGRGKMPKNTNYLVWRVKDSGVEASVAE
ncbi:MAG: hypothetical protein IKW31_01835 [Alistipes sp.]|nr:hypothetical protein [Alistipes sp.]